MTEPLVSERLARLSPHKRQLLEQRLRERRLDPAATTAAEPSRPGPFELVTAADRARLPEGLEDAYPLSTVQLGMLYHMEATASDAAPAYHNVNSFHLRAPFVETAFRRAMQEVVDRHAVLRTSFDLTSFSEPLQLVHRRAEMRLVVEDLTAASPTEQRDRVRSFSEEELRRLVDLSRPSLVSLRVFRRSEDSFQLILIEPHAIADGWSTNTTLAEIFERYFAILKGRPLPAPVPPAATVRDFIALERRALASAECRHYWQESLRDATVLELPRWQGADTAISGLDRKVVAYPAMEVVEGLRELGRLAGTPFKAVLLAAHLEVLGRASGTLDVMTGLTVHGRPEEAGATELRGMFLSTLPLRLDLRRASWVELVRATFAAETELWRHRHFPLAAIQKLLGRRDLFDVAFGFLNFHSVAPVFEGGDLEILPVGNLELSQPHFALSTVFTLEPIPPHRLRLCLEYDDRRLARTQVRTYLDLYGRVLEDMARRPLDQPGRRTFLGRVLEHQILREWNDTAGAERREDLVPERIAERARRGPERVAVVGGDEHWSYGELWRQAGRVAAGLRRAGVGTEDLVGLHLERGAHLLAVLLGVWRAGAAYLPLDPAYPAERLAFMVEDSGCRLLVSQGGALGTGVPARGWEELLGEGAAAAEGPAAELEPASLAYVLYTSGSTGRPKGVQVHHGALANFLLAMEEAPGLSAGDRLLAVTSLSFDIAGLELYLPLVAGATVEVADRETAADGQRLAAALPGATVMQATPATWRMLVDAGWAGSPRLRALCGGEALPPSLAAELLARTAEVWNLYGPTETTIWSTASRLSAPPGQRPEVLIGRPIRNTSALVLDPRWLPTAPGVPGELLLGGSGVARGYLRRPALTASRFVPDPLGEAPGGQRVYRTGDLARRLPDGRLDFLGRTDHQVKVRGYRIELGEIEAALLQHPGLAAAVVVGDRGPDGETRLVAYHLAREGAAPTAGALRELLREKLPSFMVPAFFVALTELPRTPAGKLDRRRLPAPEGEPVEALAADLPRTGHEELLGQLVAEVLRRPGLVPLSADFFEIGGDSLSATRLISRLRAVFEVDLSLAEVFAAASLRAVAALIAERQAEGGAPLPPLEPAPAEAAGQLSPAQERLWFVAQLAAGESAFNIPLSVRLLGDLDLAALTACLRELASRQSVLRTRFVAVAGQPRALVEPPGSGRSPLIDLSGLPEPTREELARELARQEAARPFDLERGPIWRHCLVRLQPGSHLGLFTTHHIASDGWSMGVLIREVSELYAAARQGRVPSLPALPVQYGDFAAWQRRWLAQEAGERLLDYWRRKLAGLAEPPPLPLDRPRSGAAGWAGGLLPFRLDRQTSERLSALARGEGATLFMVLLAAFKTLLHRSSGATDVIVGTDVAGRPRLETEPLIGFFVNLLPLRTSLAGDPTFRQLLARVRETALGAYLHQDLPFPRLVEELRPNRESGRSPFFDALFVLQNAPQERLEAPGLEITPYPVAEESARFDLALFVIPGAEGLGGSWSYRRSLFDPETVARLAGRFSTLLRDAVANPDRRLGDLAFLAEQELEQRQREQLRRREASRLKLRTAMPSALSLDAPQPPERKE
ncbi:MAG TPA: amino acid adenylation domain-containing protein [Thermoanaerobaculia bacterium]|nr:amino acid adenylation domain-containing protein [Thermoanaerobaculia bacterium]